MSLTTDFPGYLPAIVLDRQACDVLDLIRLVHDEEATVSPVCYGIAPTPECTRFFYLKHAEREPLVRGLRYLANLVENAPSE